MKIGFLGNTNNYPLSLACAIRDLGHEVVFVVDKPDALHRPESTNSALLRSYGQWLHDVSPLRARDIVLPTPRRRRVLRLLLGVDALVLNGYGPAFWPMLRKPAIVILTGADLEIYANERTLRVFLQESRRPGLRGLADRVRGRFIVSLARLQRLGITSAAAVEYAFPGMLPHGDALLEELGVAVGRRRCFMLTDLASLVPTPARDNGMLRIFSATRLNWVQPMPAGSSVLDAKGTDVMLRGVAEFRRRTARPIELRLVKKGLHVGESIEYARSLGLERIITWLEEMPLQMLHQEFVAADVVLDHFGEGSIGVAGRDALALARPVIANVKPEIFRTHLGEEIPVLQAATEREVADHLEALADDVALRDRIGWAGRRFAERYFSPAVAARDVVDTLGQALRGAR